MFPNLRSPIIATILLAFALLLTPNQAASAATKVYVDDDKVECPSATYTAGDGIQAAIDAVPDGTTIYVCSGTYTNFSTGPVLDIFNRKNLKIIRYGTGAALVQLSVDTGGESASIVSVDNSSGILIQGLTINGNNHIIGPSPTKWAQGIWWRNSSGQIKQNTVTNIGHVSPFSGNPDDGMEGIWVGDENGDGKVTKVTIDGNTVNEFENRGIVVRREIVATIKNNNVTAKNPPPADFYQAGISIEDGARATISGNTISHMPNGQGITINHSSRNSISSNTLDDVNQAISIRTSCSSYDTPYIGIADKNKVLKNTATNVYDVGVIVAANTDSGNTHCNPSASANSVTSNILKAGSSGANTGIRVEVSDNDGPTGFTPSASKTVIAKNTATGFSTLIEDNGNYTKSSSNRR